MKIRSVLTLTGIVAAILGALVAYLILSVPNDIRADGLLKEARTQMTEGKNDSARETLVSIVQQYPRTDAAAAATVALMTLNHNERNELASAIALLRKQNEEQTKLISQLQKKVTSIQAAQAEAAKPAPQMQGPPKPPEKNVTPAKKATPKKSTKKTTSRTTRRRR
jgi:hypothetical protein